MNINSNNLLSTKKQKLKKQIRSKYLENYMRKIRVDMIGNQELDVCRNVINRFFDEGNKEIYEGQKREMVEKLIYFANQGHTGAIVGLAELLLCKKITVKLILQSQRNQNQQNNKNTANNKPFINQPKPLRQQQQSPTLTQILTLPKKQRQGWLAFIRVLLMQNYCTQQMIYFCLQTLIDNLASYEAKSYAIEIIYLLVVENRIFKMGEMVEMLLRAKFEKGEKDNWNGKQEQQMQKKHFTGFFISSLMQLSKNETNFTNYQQTTRTVQQLILKLIRGMFKDTLFLQTVLIPCVSLQLISNFIKLNFLSKNKWIQRKAMQIMTDLLIFFLNNQQKYSLPTAIQTYFWSPLSIIMKEIYQISKEKYIKEQFLGSYHTRFDQQFWLAQANSKSKQIKNIQENFKFVQQSIYLISVVVEDYMGLERDIELVMRMLTEFKIIEIMCYMYGYYGKDVKKIKQEAESDVIQLEVQNSSNGRQQAYKHKLDRDELSKCMLVEDLQKLVVKYVQQITQIQHKLESNIIQCPDQKMRQFVQLHKRTTLKHIQLSELKDIKEMRGYYENRSNYYYGGKQIQFQSQSKDIQI